jgi:tyrosyl-tRNA synthetase
LGTRSSCGYCNRNFTAQLGDPSGKDTMRPILSEEETRKNADSIEAQVARIFGDPDSNHPQFNNIKIHRNSQWLDNMSAGQLLNTLSKFTTAQLLVRDSFQKRMEDGNSIGMHELVVPILQGFDSVQLESDVEIGGTDQLFNFGITRDMQRLHGQTPEICMLMPIINGTDGRKMSKSFGNCIFLNDTPNDVFGKTMSISDELMKDWWPVVLDSDFPTPDPAGGDISEDLHPMKLKKDLAWHITQLIWGHEKAKVAEENFESVIQGNKIPEDIKLVSYKVGISIEEMIMELRGCSKTEAKRLIKSNAVKFVTESNEFVTIEAESLVFMAPGVTIKVGKKDFAKLI